MIRSPHDRPYSARLITPPRRDLQGGFSPARLLIQAARLSWEIRGILQLINGMRLNLSEELQVHSEASDMLLDAAHATAVMEARLPLAPAWGSGPPRSRSIFAQARQAGSDPAQVCADVLPQRPRIDPQVLADLHAALHDDPDPDAQCVGTTLKRERCTKTIVRGIGAKHCSVHLTSAERYSRDRLRVAQDRHVQALHDALADQRLDLVDSWIQRYGHRPHRVELPTLPTRTRGTPPVDERAGVQSGLQEQPLIALHDTGWPQLCPRSAEIITALMARPQATTTQLAEAAAAQSPHRWASAEQWLESSIWDGIQPPDFALPAPEERPELDEHPFVQVLRRQLEDGHHEWRHWHSSFAVLVEACDDPPVDTMAELLAFWQDIGILTTSDRSAHDPLWSVPPSPPSPWRVLFTRGHLVPPRLLASALDCLLLDSSVPVDPDLPPREVFNLIVTPSAHDNYNTDMAASLVTTTA
ncbi:hypothetical protein HCN51_55105 [Nonomuraea sp. FMUSA5-5]|uniref:DUF222 domain-containing protein n=1 Tax=Nonomuraea composti TaxID=2720023 RepID=A0ABX1BPD8_9ACTN|nr:hypothetical protein [Nonomuraea sp. FMUSA5-5]NJP98459.1 hypothetical protein [Nonomuraea sp. FMUSA5-5]